MTQSASQEGMSIGAGLNPNLGAAALWVWLHAGDVAEQIIVNQRECVHGMRPFECGQCSHPERRFVSDYSSDDPAPLNRYAINHDPWNEMEKDFAVVSLAGIPWFEMEPKDLIRYFLDLGVPWAVQPEGSSRYFPVVRSFVGVKQSFAAVSNRDLYTVPRKARGATVSKAALDQIFQSDPQDFHRKAALTQTLVYGAKVEDAAKAHGQSVGALTKHRQRILQEIRLRFPEEVTEVEPQRVKFQYRQFERGIGPGTDPKRWEAGET